MRVGVHRVHRPKLLHDRRLGFDVPCDEVRRIEFVQLGRVHADRVGVDRRALQVTGEGRDEARIHATGQIRADRHVRFQSLVHGSQHDLLKFIDQTARVIAAFFVTPIGKIHFPIRAVHDLGGSAAFAAGRDFEEVSGAQQLHALEARDRPRQCGEREDVVKAQAVGPRRHHAGSQQRFDLGREQQPVALPRPVERADPEPVAPEQQASPALVPQGDGKLPAQPLEHSPLMLLPKMRDDFRVAVLHQTMPARFQFRPLFEVVKQLTIEDHDDVPVLIGHRLLSIREADDTQPARRQRDSRLKKEAFLVGAAMDDGPRHSPHDFVRHGSLLGEINDACYAAHESLVLWVIG